MSRLLLILLLCCSAAVAQPITYMWLTDEEETSLGDRVYFGHGDTLGGPVHSNSQLCITRDPVFLDMVTTAAASFVHGPGYIPQFLGPAPHYRAPQVVFPTTLSRIRTEALVQGHRFTRSDWTYRVVMDRSWATIYHWPTAEEPDTTINTTLVTVNNTCMFFEGPVEVRGTLTGTLFIGSGTQVRIIDNCLYSDSDPVTGRVPLTSTNYLVLASEGDVKIANTVANGFENSHGQGRLQTDADLTDVTIAGMVCALGESFTFEQQNDRDSGYVCTACGCDSNGIGGGPDDRGTVYLYGAVKQVRRGYLHRTNCTSTGYETHYRFDPRLREFDTMTDDDPGRASTDSLDLGDVFIDSTRIDTLIVGFWDQHTLGTVTTAGQFRATRPADLTNNLFPILISFTPTQNTRYTGAVYVHVGVHAFTIRLVGRGIPWSDADDPFTLHPSSFSLSAFPNPFNPVTELRWNLPETGFASLVIYDLLGHQVATLVNEVMPPGEHAARFDGSALSSGLYFAHLQTAQGRITTKLLLVK
jgi:hypothetical protein